MRRALPVLGAHAFVSAIDYDTAGGSVTDLRATAAMTLRGAKGVFAVAGDLARGSIGGA